MIGRRRGLLLGLGTAALLAVTAGCGGSAAAPQATRSATPTPTAPTGPTILTFAVAGPAPVITAYTKIAADFSAAHPDVVVNVRPYDTTAQAVAAVRRESEAGDPPDVFLSSREELPGLLQRELIQPVDVLLGERQVDFGDGFQRDSLEQFSAGSALQCMPVDFSPMVVYYNTDLIHLASLYGEDEPGIEAGAPWTLDDFAAAAAAGTRGRIRGVYVAPHLDQLAPFIWSAGGSLVDDETEPTRLTLSDGSSRSGLEQLLEVIRNPRLTPSERLIRRRGPVQLFKAGQLAMMLGYRDLTPRLRQQADLHFGVMPIPRIGSKSTAAQARALCLSSRSEHVDAAADFIAAAVSAQSEEALARTGYVVPTNLDVLNADAFLQPTQQPADAEVFAGTIRGVNAFPFSSSWPKVERRVVPLLTRLLYDPVIDPLDERLTAIDDTSAGWMMPPPTSTPSTEATPTATPSD